MRRLVMGAFGALAFVSAGLFWWQGRAAVEHGAPPPVAAPAAVALAELPPEVEVGDLRGPALPQATEVTREQRRFGQYDRDRDGRVSRVEMLSTRTAAFRKLDKDGNNLLTFEEWAVTTVDRFAKADADRDLWLSPAEFRTTAPPPQKPKPRCECERPRREPAGRRSSASRQQASAAPATTG